MRLRFTLQCCVGCDIHIQKIIACDRKEPGIYFNNKNNNNNNNNANNNK